MYGWFPPLYLVCSLHSAQQSGVRPLRLVLLSCLLFSHHFVLMLNFLGYSAFSSNPSAKLSSLFFFSHLNFQQFFSVYRIFLNSEQQRNCGKEGWNFLFLFSIVPLPSTMPDNLSPEIIFSSNASARAQGEVAPNGRGVWGSDCLFNRFNLSSSSLPVFSQQGIWCPILLPDSDINLVGC